MAHSGLWPEWQRIGNQIKAAFVFARSDFVNVFNLCHDFLRLRVAMGCSRALRRQWRRMLLQREQHSGEDQIAVVKV